jgi:uncharacterized HAD superfamily protein
MKIRRLGFDLDDVLADTSPALVDYAREVHGVELTDEQKKIFKWDETPGLDQEIVEDINEKLLDPTFFMEVKPVDGAVEALKFLRKKGRSLNVITARPENNFAFTSKWLEDNGLWCHTLTCCPSKRKQVVAAKLELQTFIDDRFDILMNFVNFRQSGRWKKLAVMHKDWNAHLHHEKIFRVRNWDEIINLLEVRGGKSIR